MLWYPSPDEIVKANKIAVRKDKHRDKLLRTVDGIQATIDSVKDSESMGLTYQAALFMKKLTTLHAFDGGNHRTAYSIAILFLIKNGVKVRVVPASVSYGFSKGIASKKVEELQEWIGRHMAT